MKKADKKFVIVDGNAIIHRAFHAVPPLTTRDGLMVNALYGFVNIILKVQRELKPTHMAVAFDVKGKTFRHEMYSEYKATRKKQPDELYAQMPLTREACKVLGLQILELKGYEADDVIGTIAEKLTKDDSVETYIVTGDMDILQLVDEQTKVFAMRKGVSDTVIYDIPGVAEKFTGLTPEQIIEYKGLRGDTSDNIPGVRGVGEKTALKLLADYNTIEGVYEHIDDLKGALHKKLVEQKDMAFLSRTLATIDRNAPIEFNLEKTKIVEPERKALLDFITTYEFSSLKKYVPEETAEEKAKTTKEKQTRTSKAKEQVEPMTFADLSTATLPSDAAPNAVPETDATYTLVDSIKKAEQLAKQLVKQFVFAFDTETTAIDPLQCDLVGVSIAWKTAEAYYIPAKFCAPLWPVFENKQIGKFGHNVKFDVKVLKATQDVDVKNIAYDTMLAAYILNPGTRGYSLDALALKHCGYVMMSYEDLVGKKERGKPEPSILDVPLEKLSFYAAEDADYTWRLYEVLQPLVKKENLVDVLKMDIDILPVLAKMELAGISLDVPFLEDLNKKCTKQLQKTEKKIYACAGEEFNIASPKQLSHILFEVLEIDTDGLKKTKTGISTAATELDKLRGKHEIIDLITEYRELAKLLSTYIETLPQLVNPKTHRVHTTFNQTIAATGRLSSIDPNLQNIPIRTELGREVRAAFIAPRGKRLLAIDYSQIELRVVAHMVQDEMFIDAFKAGADIHTRTAAATQDVKEEDVTKEMRRAAKSVNFGLLYGMGVRGLMRDTDMDYAEAKAYLENYFTLHPKIKQYIADTKVLAAEQGYVETLFGRKRFLPEITSRMAMVRAGAERAAINHPIQGTAADIMKMAMLKVADAIEAGKVNAEMLLQVHDELVFEVDADMAEKEAEKISKIMEDVYTLDVPLVVEAEIGKNWREAK